MGLKKKEMYAEEFRMKCAQIMKGAETEILEATVDWLKEAIEDLENEKRDMMEQLRKECTSEEEYGKVIEVLKEEGIRKKEKIDRKKDDKLRSLGQ